MSGTGREAATCFFHLEPASVRCPYPALAALRREEPVAWFDEVEAFVVTRYDLIIEVLRQPELFSSRSATGPVIERQVAATMRELVAEDGEIRALVKNRPRSSNERVLVSADPPAHTRQRALVNRAFSPPVVRELEPSIAALADSLIDSFVDRGRVEIMSEFATPLPMTVIAIALGVELDRLDDFKKWSDGIVSGFGKAALGKDDLSAIVRARLELEQYLSEFVRDRQREPRDDLISQIVTSRIDGESLRDDEIIDMTIQFLIAGNETTAKVITAAMLYLARDPALADSLRDDPDRVAPFVEEVLRLEPPTTGIYRIATADYELGGQRIPAGACVWLSYAAGNRDPERFDGPDECQAARKSSSPHLGFGHGVHFCLGAGLARAESRLGLQALLRRCDDFRLDGTEANVVYDQSYMIHGISRLPLTFRRRGS